MKKRYLLLILFVFFMMPKVSAICTDKAYTDLQAKAYRTQLKWEFIKNEVGTKYFSVSLYNLDKEVMLKYDGIEYKNISGENVQLSNYFYGGRAYVFKFYGNYKSQCPEEFLYQKTLEIPKYNDYSERKECIEFEEFPLCNKYYKGEILSEEYFLDMLEKYKKSIEPKIKEEIKDNRNILEKFIDLYKENLIISVSSTILILGGATFMLVNSVIKRKNGIKLGSNR